MGLVFSTLILIFYSILFLFLAKFVLGLLAVSRLAEQPCPPMSEKP